MALEQEAIAWLLAIAFYHSAGSSSQAVWTHWVDRP